MNALIKQFISEATAPIKKKSARLHLTLHPSFGYVTAPKTTASNFKLFKLARY
jgi:hypothetical protein